MSRHLNKDYVGCLNCGERDVYACNSCDFVSCAMCLFVWHPKDNVSEPALTAAVEELLSKHEDTIVRGDEDGNDLFKGLGESCRLAAEIQHDAMLITGDNNTNVK